MKKSIINVVSVIFIVCVVTATIFATINSIVHNTNTLTIAPMNDVVEDLEESTEDFTDRCYEFVDECAKIQEEYDLTDEEMEELMYDIFF